MCSSRMGWNFLGVGCVGFFSDLGKQLKKYISSLIGIYRRKGWRTLKNISPMGRYGHFLEQ